MTDTRCRLTHEEIQQMPESVGVIVYESAGTRRVLAAVRRLRKLAAAGIVTQAQYLRLVERFGVGVGYG